MDTNSVLEVFYGIEVKESELVNVLEHFLQTNVKLQELIEKNGWGKGHLYNWEGVSDIGSIVLEIQGFGTSLDCITGKDATSNNNESDSAFIALGAKNRRIDCPTQGNFMNFKRGDRDFNQFFTKVPEVNDADDRRLTDAANSLGLKIYTGPSWILRTFKE